MASRPGPRLRTQLIAFVFTRTVINTGFRMVYPFMPVFARALGVDIEAIALAVTARSALGITGPLFGSLGDQIGRKMTMLAGLIVFFAGMIIVVIWPTYPSFFLALLIGAAAKLMFDPSMQAYIGDRVEYGRRGRAIAITEFGWSGAALVGIPLVGWVIAYYGWVSPFILLGALAVIACIIIFRTIPGEGSTSGKQIPLKEGLQSILAHPSAIAALIVVVLISAGNESINLIYGVWLEDSFALKVIALGSTSIVIGLAELSGEGLVAGYTDRLGKRRAVSIGIVFIVVSCVILPIVGQNLLGALIGIFLLFISFEFTFVSIIPIMTEIVPSARATLAASSFAAAAIGRAVGAFVSPSLFKNGIMANALLATALAILALVVFRRFVRVE
ncbi:MAG: MFS transporter [Anaerolineales bacterium]